MFVWTVCKVKNFEHNFEQNVVMENFVGFDDGFVGQDDRSASKVVERSIQTARSA